MGPRAVTVVGLGWLLAVAWACTSCAASGVTAGRLEDSLGQSFSRLYDVQQLRLGHSTGRTAPAAASCARHKAGDTERGAGDDWACTVDFPFPDGHVQPISYDVRVQATGCYTAQGPSQVVGPQQQRTSAGAPMTNPLFEFDGCFALG